MSKLLCRKPFTHHGRAGRKKRQRHPKNRTRRHLVETLERRDHPGSMLEVSAIALLGRPNGESTDPIDQMLRTAQSMLARRELDERRTSLKQAQAGQPLHHHGLEQLQTTGLPKRASPDRDAYLARRAAAHRRIDRHLPSASPPAASPLLISISDSFVSAGLDHLPDSVVDAATGRSSIGPSVTAGASGGGGASGGSGGSKAPAGQPADQAGSTMNATPRPASSGCGDGGTSSDVSNTNTAASTGETITMTETAAAQADSTAIVPTSSETLDEQSAIAEEAAEPIAESVNSDTSQISNSIFIGCDGSDPLADWTTNQFGGSDTGYGTVLEDGAGILASEGDSLLVTMTRSISIPDSPTVLMVGFEASFDETTDDRINDAFEVALLDADGYSVVPTIAVNHDSYFNITESVGAIAGENTQYVQNDPDDYLSGLIKLDISNLIPGQEFSLVMRLVNNDDDTGSWFRITCNHPIPTATDDFYATMQDTVLVATDPTLTANDYDEDARTITVVTDSVTKPAHGSVSVNPDGEFTYIPEPGFFGDDSFTYHATNGVSTSVTAATVHITVGRATSPPTSTHDEYTVAEDDELTADAPGVLINDTDIDGDPMTAIIKDQAVHGSVTLGRDGSFTYVPDADFFGSDTWTYIATNSIGESEPASVIVTVTSVNDVIDDAISTVQDTPINGDVSTNDLFIATSTFAVHDDAAHGAVSWLSSHGVFTYTPDPDFVGIDSFTYTATDTFGSTEIGTVTITVASLQEFAKFYVVDHSQHDVFRYDDDGDFIENWGYDTRNRSRGITANALGDTLWTVTAGHDIVVYTPEGAEIGSWQARVNGKKKNAGKLNAAEGIATDGTNIWTVDRAKDTVLYFAEGAAHRSGAFNATSYFGLHSRNKDASGIATDGTNLYVLNGKNHSPRIFVYSLSGRYLGDWELNVGGGNHDLQGITTNPSGGTELWVVDKKTDAVYYFPDGTTYRNGSHAKTSEFALHADNRNPYGIADPPSAGFTPTIAWRNAAGGDWNDPANWTDLVDPNAIRVPNANDHVLIDIVGGDFDVTIAGGYDADYNPLPAMQAARLYSSDPIVITYDGGLTLSGTSEIDQLSISSGTLLSDGDLTIGKNLDWAGGAIAGDGTFTLMGAGLIHGTSTKSIGTIFFNDGDVILQDNAALEIGRKISVGSYYEHEYYPGVLHNRASGTIDIQSDADITDAFSPDNVNGITSTRSLFHNEGMLRKTQGTNTTMIGVPFENDSSVNANASVRVESGTLQIQGSGISSGHFFINENRTLQLSPRFAENDVSGTVDLDSPAITLTSAATISGDGTLEISQGVSNISGDVNVGAIVINGGGGNFNGSLVTDSLQVSDGVIRMGVTVPTTIEDVTVSGGTLDDDSGLTIARELLMSGTPTIQGDGATRVIGNMQIDSVPWSGNPELIDHTLLLQGTTDWIHGHIAVDGASQIINSGVLNVTGDGSATFFSDEYENPSSIAKFINEGTINHSGTNYFAIDIPFQTSGTVYVAPNKTLSLGSLDPVVISDGLFTLDNATLQLASNYDGGSYGRLQIEGGEIAVSGRISGSIENGGALTLSGSPSTLKVDGDFTQTARGTTRLNIQGSIAGSEYDQIQVAGLISLNGELEVKRDWETRVGDQFTLLINEDDHFDENLNQQIVDPVMGEFAGKSERKPWILDGEVFRVTYKGGTGNEIILHHSGPGIELGDVRINEGSDPDQLIEVPVTLDAPALHPVSIDYATEDRLAIAGLDYQPSSGTIVFAPGKQPRWSRSQCPATGPPIQHVTLSLPFPHPSRGRS